MFTLATTLRIQTLTQIGCCFPTQVHSHAWALGETVYVYSVHTSNESYITVNVCAWYINKTYVLGAHCL